jgi:hypothetical protein
MQVSKGQSASLTYLPASLQTTTPPLARQKRGKNEKKNSNDNAL